MVPERGKGVKSAPKLLQANLPKKYYIYSSHWNVLETLEAFLKTRSSDSYVFHKVDVYKILTKFLAYDFTESELIGKCCSRILFLVYVYSEMYF